MIVLVPVYRPGPELGDLVADLLATAPGVGIVVVDDGSGCAYTSAFDALSGRGCTVLRHPANRGKGAALKTGFRHIAETRPDRSVVCADADGQHSAADIVRVGQRVRATGHMVLGVRRFEGDVPLRSRVGNIVTRLLFRAATGHVVVDTQTGLRGCPPGLLDWLRRVPGDRFEYEMNVLLHAARDGYPIEQTAIATTYLAANASSHFGWLADSVRIYRPLLRFLAAGLFAQARPGR